MTLNNFQLNRYLNHLLGICYFIILMVSLMLIVKYWIKDWQLVHLPLKETPLSTATDDPKALLTALKSSHLFGKSFPKGVLPLSNLQFSLTGIVKGARKQESKVYLSISNNPAKIYSIGDNLAYGVQIYDITTDAVILDHSGRLEKLTLTRQKLEFKPFQLKA